MNEKNYPTLLKLQGNGAGETPSTGQELVTAFNENAENLLNAIKDVAKDIPSVSQQTGSGQNSVMSQEATTEALNEKFDKANVLQELGNETTMVMSQKAVRDAINAARTEYNISALVPNDEGYTLVTALPVLETILSDLGISKLFAGLKLSFVGADNVNYIYIYDNGSWYQQEIFKSTIFAEPISLTTGNKRIIQGVKSIIIKSNEARDYTLSFVDVTSSDAAQLMWNNGYYTLSGTWDAIDSQFSRISGYLNNGDWLEITIDKVILPAKLSSTLRISKSCITPYSSTEDVANRLFSPEYTLSFNNRTALTYVINFAVTSADCKYYYKLQGLYDLLNSYPIRMQVFNIGDDSKVGDFNIGKGNLVIVGNIVKYNGKGWGNDYVSMVVDYTNITSSINFGASSPVMFNHNTITYIPENIGEKNDYLRLFKNYTITNNNTQVVNGVVSLRMGTTKKRYDYRVGYIDPTTDGTTYSIQLYSSVAGYLNMIAPWEQIGTSDLWKTSGYVNTGDYIEMVIDKSIITGKISSTLEISDRCFYTLSTVEDKSFRLFDLDNPLMLSNQDKLRAIRGIKVYSAEYQYYYVIRALQALTNTATLVVEVYNIDTDEKFGEITFRSADVRLNKNGIGYINANIANGDYLEFIIDYNRVNAGLNAWGGQKLRISRDCYERNEKSVEPIYYASLGSSVSTYAWHSYAAQDLGMIPFFFGIGGACYMTPAGAVLNYDKTTTPGTDDNCIMNQVARLFKKNDDEGYAPNVISFLSGLNDIGDPQLPNIGSLADAEAADFSELTPENWFTNAPSSYKTTATSMMAAIHFVTRRFPYAQVIIVTPSQTKAPRASLLAMYNLEKAIAERCALPMIDFFTKCGLSDRTDTITNFTLDNTHPNDDGQTLFRLFYVNELRRTICLRRIVTPVVTCE